MADTEEEEKITLEKLVNSPQFISMSDEGYYYKLWMRAEKNPDGFYYQHWRHFQVPQENYEIAIAK